MPAITLSNVRNTVESICKTTPVTDIHTHIYASSFGGLLLRGIDELLTYHYLVAEVFRTINMEYSSWWKLSKKKQADIIWEELFIKRSPVSEACRGVLTCVQAAGLQEALADRNLDEIRNYYEKLSAEEHIEKVFKAAGVTKVVMTNNPFDPLESPVWLDASFKPDPRFESAFRMDDVIVGWKTAVPILNGWGYKVDEGLSAESKKELKRYLSDWTERFNPRYMAVSLPPDFKYPDNSIRSRIIEEVVFPFCEENKIPFAMMIGVWKLVNPELQLAGDAVGKSDIVTLGNIAKSFPNNKFLVTFLSRENTHEHAIYSRKFRNVMPFGCWWYLNNPSLINEITRIRMETLGLSFIPQHSDARILDQLTYKWIHSRQLIADVLVDKYSDIIKSGWTVTDQEIQADVKRLFSSNFEDFVG